MIGSIPESIPCTGSMKKNHRKPKKKATDQRQLFLPFDDNYRCRVLVRMKDKFQIYPTYIATAAEDFPFGGSTAGIALPSKDNINLSTRPSISVCLICAYFF